MLIIPGRFCFTFTPGEKHPVESTAEESDDEALEEALDEDLVGILDLLLVGFLGELDLLPFAGALNEELDGFFGALLITSLSTRGRVSGFEGTVGGS